MNNGYKEVYCPTHHRANTKTGFVYEHFIEAEKMLGRPLKPHENIHHVDGNRGNNDHRNLMVMFDKKDHNRLHGGCLTVRRLDGSYTAVINRYRVNKNWIKTWYGPQPPRNKIKWPSLNDLLELLSKSSFVKVGKELGVSDNAIRKHLRSLGIDPKAVRPPK